MHLKNAQSGAQVLGGIIFCASDIVTASYKACPLSGLIYSCDLGHFIAGSVAPSGRGFRTRLVIMNDKPASGLLGLIGREALDPSVLGAIPAGANTVSVQRLRPARLLPLVRRAMAAALGGAPAGGPGPVDQMLGMASGMTGIDFNVDLLSNLEGTVALAAGPGGGVYGLGGLTIVLKVKDAEKPTGVKK